ncbi:hypothetical protein [Azospirillum sp. A39]|uniref:hypothetical protein n=1 Tax=Azospirillum sp. A39 TaxID=3462279 RepID=UPI0040463039
MVCIVHIEPCDRTRRVVARVLATAGYATIPASSLTSRWDVGLPSPAALLVVDVTALPSDIGAGMAELRRRAPGARLLMTTGGHPPGASAAAPCDRCTMADAMLQKPFENEPFIAEVTRLLALPAVLPPARPPAAGCAAASRSGAAAGEGEASRTDRGGAVDPVA